MNNNFDVHMYEEVVPDSQYLVRCIGDASRQEFIIEGKWLESFLSSFDVFRPGYDTYIYKLVSSYEEIE